MAAPNLARGKCVRVKGLNCRSLWQTLCMSGYTPLGQAKLEELVCGWQKLLGLDEWTIRLEVVRFKRSWQSGDVKVDPVHRSALLLLSAEPFRDEEETIVHELVHVVLWPLDTAAMDLTEVTGPEGSAAREFARAAVFRALEPVAEQLARALLRVRGHQTRPVWDVLEAEAAERAEFRLETGEAPGEEPPSGAKVSRWPPKEG